MADEVGNGQQLLEYHTNDKGMVVRMDQVFAWKTGDVTNFPDEFPLRRSVGPRADANMELLEPGPSAVYVVKEILQSKTVHGSKWYKVHWEGYAKSDATWEPAKHLTEWGVDALVAEFRMKQRGYMAMQLHLDEETLAVMELIQMHGLKRSVEFYLQKYKKECTGVSDRRLQELHGKEHAAVRKNKTTVALRINPESKKPLPEMPEGDENFRLLVMGHSEPEEWKTGPHDAPVIGDATFTQMFGAGTDLDDSDQRLRAIVAGQQCKPANRRQIQLWKKALVTEQEKCEA